MQHYDRRDLAGLNAFLKATPHCNAAILCHNGKDAVKLGDMNEKSQAHKAARPFERLRRITPC